MEIRKRKAMTVSSIPRAIFTDNWTEPRPLDPELPPVPELEVNLLPAPLRVLVSDIADRTRVPVDIPAVCAIISAAGCAGRRFEVRPKRLDWSWREPLNLWGGFVAIPGFLKSPTMNEVTRPLHAIQRDWNQQNQITQARLEELKALADVSAQQWEASAKAALKAGRPAPPRPDDTIYNPGLRNLVLTDSTPEKAHLLLSENPGGLIMVRDELSGWFADIERPGRESERALWLTGWNGRGAHSVHRIGRGDVYVENVCLSLLGAMVPDGVKTYFGGLFTGQPGSNDGLLQRLQCLVWPEMVAYEYIDRPPDQCATDGFERVCRAFVNLSPASPLQMTFNEESREVFVEWLTLLEHRFRSGQMAQFLTSHLMKYRGFMPRLAGLFQAIEMAARGDLDTGAVPADEFMPEFNTRRHIVLEPPAPRTPSDVHLIDCRNTQRAIALCDYFEGHARRVYSCMTTPDMSAAHEISRHILAGDIKPSPIFSTRDIYRRGWAGLKENDLVLRGLLLLEDFGWVRQLDAPPKTGGRPPSDRWQLHPKFPR
jgi:hypothetical protein